MPYFAMSCSCSMLFACSKQVILMLISGMWLFSQINRSTCLSRCNALDLLRQVSVSYLPSLPCLVLACCSLPCHHLQFISCHHVHHFCIRVRFMHPSIFSVVRFAIRRSYVPRRPLLPFSVSG